MSAASWLTMGFALSAATRRMRVPVTTCSSSSGKASVPSAAVVTPGAAAASRPRAVSALTVDDFDMGAPLDGSWPM
jgi:hypothetical protein